MSLPGMLFPERPCRCRHAPPPMRVPPRPRHHSASADLSRGWWTADAFAYCRRGCGGKRECPTESGSENRAPQSRGAPPPAGATPSQAPPIRSC